MLYTCPHGLKLTGEHCITINAVSFCHLDKVSKISRGYLNVTFLCVNPFYFPKISSAWLKICIGYRHTHTCLTLLTADVAEHILLLLSRVVLKYIALVTCAMLGLCLEVFACPTVTTRTAIPTLCLCHMDQDAMNVAQCDHMSVCSTVAHQYLQFRSPRSSYP